MSDYLNSRNSLLMDPATPGLVDGDTVTLANGAKFVRVSGRWEPVGLGVASKQQPVTAISSESGLVFPEEVAAAIAALGVGEGSPSALPAGSYACGVGTRTWTGTIKPALLTLTPGAGGTAYVEATEDGTTWVPWSEGVISAATTARLAGPVVGLRVISTVAASTLGVVA